MRVHGRSRRARHVQPGHERRLVLRRETNGWPCDTGYRPRSRNCGIGVLSRRLPTYHWFNVDTVQDPGGSVAVALNFCPRLRVQLEPWRRDVASVSLT